MWALCQNPVSEQELLQAFTTVVANSGTYEILGSHLAFRPTVANHPNFMSGGSKDYQYRLEGDTLWLTQEPGIPGVTFVDLDVPEANYERVQMRRVRVE